MKKIVTWLKKFGYCYYQATLNTIKHDGIEHSGYLSFTLLLALFPFLIFCFALLGLFDETILALKLTEIISHNLPENALLFIMPRLEEIKHGPPQSFLTIAVLSAIWVASSSVEAMRTILNRAYHVSTPPTYLKGRLLSIIQFLLLTSLLLLGILLFILLPVMLEHLTPFLPFSEEIISQFGKKLNFFRYFTSYLLWLITVSLLYYLIPNLKQNWRQVLPGAILVVFLWSFTAIALSFNLNRFEQVRLLYGSSAVVIIVLLFFYLMAMIFVFGAEFNYLWEKASGFKFIEKKQGNAKKTLT